LLWRDLEVIVSILVLEETLGIKSFSVDQEFELILNVLSVLLIDGIWFVLSIERLSSSVIKGDIDRSLKVFLGENFVNAVTEFSPFDMSTSFWCLEMISQ